MRATKSQILTAVGDLVSNLLYYDRVVDEDLPLGKIQQAVQDDVVTENDIVEKFREQLNKGLNSR